METVANFVSLPSVLTVSHCDPADTGTGAPLLPLPMTDAARGAGPLSFAQETERCLLPQHDGESRPGTYSSGEEQSLGLFKVLISQGEDLSPWAPLLRSSYLLVAFHDQVTPCSQKPTLLAAAWAPALGLSGIPLHCRRP